MDQLVKPVTWLFGVVLTVVGVLGFVMPSPLLGLFEVNTVHNIIHLLSGVVGLGAAASGYANSRLYLIIFGLVYALVTVLGFVMLSPLLSNMDENYLFLLILLLDFVNINMADNYLHLAIAAVTLIVGFGSSKMMHSAPMSMPS